MNNLPAMTEEQRQELIRHNRAKVDAITPQFLKEVSPVVKRHLQSEIDSAKILIVALTAPPAPVLRVPDDYFAKLVQEARLRADKAMRKFPQPNYVLNKVAEESGEVIKAVIHYTEGREDWLSVEGELIDNLAMLIRLVKEGDQVIGFSPPDFVKRLITTGGQQ